MRVSVRPLFAGYLFFQADAEGRQAALSTGPPAQAMAVADQEKRQRQLQAVFWVCAETVSLELVDFVKPGKTLRTIDEPFWDEPFTGLTGVIPRIKNSRRVVLNVDAIGQGVALEVGLKQVQP